MGLAVFYGLYVLIGAPAFLFVLAVRSKGHLHARHALIAGLVSAFCLSAFGVFWWATNFPEDLTLINIAAFCLAPGFILGAAFYGIFVKSLRLVKKVGSHTT